MASIVIIIDGQEVSATTTPDIMRSIMLKSMEEQLQQKLAMTVCPDHQAAPEVIVNITHGRQQVSINGCCQRLIDMTHRALTSG